MLCRIKEDLKNLHKELTVGGTSLSLRKYVETLQEKYESKVVQDSRCDLKHLTQMTKGPSQPRTESKMIHAPAWVVKHWKN